MTGRHWYSSPADAIYVWVSGTMILAHLSLGVAVLAGGRPRFSLPSYQPLITIVGGHVWIWGAVTVAAALLMAAPWRRVSVAGLIIGTSWMWTWAVTFAWALVKSPTSVATAMVAYAALALIDTALLTVRVAEPRPTTAGLANPRLVDPSTDSSPLDDHRRDHPDQQYHGHGEPGEVARDPGGDVGG